MKSFLIVILLVLLIGENVYIYMQPDTVCDLIKEKGDEWKSQLIPDDLKSKWKEELKNELTSELEAEIDARVDSLIPTD